MKTLKQFISEKILINKNTKYSNNNIKEYFAKMLECDLQHNFLNDIEKWCKQKGLNKFVGFTVKFTLDFCLKNEETKKQFKIKNEYDMKILLDKFLLKEAEELCFYDNINLYNASKKGDDYIRIYTYRDMIDIETPIFTVVFINKLNLL